MRAYEFGHGARIVVFSSVWNCGVFESERCFGDDGFDGCIHSDGHFEEGVDGGVSSNVGLYLLFGDSQLPCEVGLFHSSFFEDVFYVISDVHSVCINDVLQR